MKWAIQFSKEPTKTVFFMEVENGTTPPLIGDKFNIPGEAFCGLYEVSGRSFELELLNPITGECNYGWSIKLREREGIERLL